MSDTVRWFLVFKRVITSNGLGLHTFFTFPADFPETAVQTATRHITADPMSTRGVVKVKEVPCQEGLRGLIIPIVSPINRPIQCKQLRLPGPGAVAEAPPVFGAAPSELVCSSSGLGPIGLLYGLGFSVGLRFRKVGCWGN